MHLPRQFTRHYSVRTIFIALIAIAAFSSFSDNPLTLVAAPTVAAKVAFDENYLPADVPSSGDVDLDRTIFRIAASEGVDPRLIHAVIWQESKYKPAAASHKGAQGLMQLMPATAKRFKCDDVSNPEENVKAGTKYLRWLLKRFDGNVSLALAGYNAGEGSVDKYDGIPPFDETQKYVRIITGRYGKNFHPLLTAEEAKVRFNLLPTTAELR